MVISWRKQKCYPRWYILKLIVTLKTWLLCSEIDVLRTISESSLTHTKSSSMMSHASESLLQCRKNKTNLCVGPLPVIFTASCWNSRRKQAVVCNFHFFGWDGANSPQKKYFLKHVWIFSGIYSSPNNTQKSLLTWFMSVLKATTMCGCHYRPCWSKSQRYLFINKSKFKILTSKHYATWLKDHFPLLFRGKCQNRRRKWHFFWMSFWHAYLGIPAL
jgi:hypothetical protein